MTALSIASLKQVHASRPKYNLDDVHIGVVHFGPGAFHRAHQAAYFDTINATDPRWGICGVSLHSAGVRDILREQNFLYTLAILDNERAYRVIGSIREILVAHEDSEAVFERLTRPGVQIVTTTVTEKGYCLAPDFTLDLKHPDVEHDIVAAGTPRSLIGYLVEGLRRRRALNIPPFVTISCDNLPSNGRRLKDALVLFARQLDPDLANWISSFAVCPETMVDSITPATDDQLRASVASRTGLDDAWPIQREAFAQWVIERHQADGGPDWMNAGVIITENVAGYEQAKIRLLNAAHSTIAYLGLHRGYETVAEAMNDADIAATVRTLMFEDIVPILTAPPGMDLFDYATLILGRFRNPAIAHRLAQIAWDGSQKLPIRLLRTLSEALEQDRDIRRLTLSVAAWMIFIRSMALRGAKIVDPMSDILTATGNNCMDHASDVYRFLALDKIFPPQIARNAEIGKALEANYADLLGQK